jgi:hypothetical protein
MVFVLRINPFIYVMEAVGNRTIQSVTKLTLKSDKTKWVKDLSKINVNCVAAVIIK